MWYGLGVSISDESPHKVHHHFTEMCSGSEAGAYLRLIDFVSLNSWLESHKEEGVRISDKSPHKVHHLSPLETNLSSGCFLVLNLKDFRRVAPQGRYRANSVQLRHSGPDYGPDFGVKALKTV